MSTPAEILYQQIKSDESQFPIPAPYVTLNVGTFDAASGTFKGLTKTVEFDPEPIEHRPGQHPINPPPHFQASNWISITINARWQRTITTVPAPKVTLAPVLLQFSVVNAGTAWSVVANGITVSASAGQTTLKVGIWDAAIANWTIQAGANSHTDTLRIQRPVGQLVSFGVGAFTIPVLPSTIVYAPPADSSNKSVASYVQNQTVGSTATTSFSTDSSGTSTNEQGKYAGGVGFEAGLGSISQFLGLAGPTYAAGVKAIGDISSLLGKFTSTITTGTTDTNDTQVTFVQTTSDTLSTVASAGGPGSGDLVCFYKNVRMVWSTLNGQLQLYPFDFTLTAFPASGIRKNLGNGSLGISDTDAQMLLALDPFFAGGPEAEPPAGRFTPTGDNYEYGLGVSLGHTASVTRDLKNTTTEKSYTTTTDQWDAGPIFQLLGLGGKDSTTITLSNATGTDVSSTITMNFTLAAGPQDHFAVTLWYDNLFGTFAFQQVALSPSVRLQGKGATPGQEVVLVSGAKTFRTVADQNGNYGFWTSTIPAGGAMLAVGNQTPVPVMVAAM